MDRRRFLTGRAWAGLASGLASLGAACRPEPAASGDRAGPGRPSRRSRTPGRRRRVESAAAIVRPAAVRCRRSGDSSRSPTRTADRGPATGTARSIVPADASGFLEPGLGRSRRPPVAPRRQRRPRSTCSGTGSAGTAARRTPRSGSTAARRSPGHAAPDRPDDRAGRGAWPPALDLDDRRPTGSAACTSPCSAAARPAAAGYVPFIVRADRPAGTRPRSCSSARARPGRPTTCGAAPTSTTPARRTRRDRDPADDRGVQVSFDRPYAVDDGSRLPAPLGAAVRPLAGARGRDVDYIADLDLELHPELVAGRRLVVFAGPPRVLVPADADDARGGRRRRA